MPLISSKKVSKLILIVLLIFSNLTFSQFPPPPPPFSDDVNDQVPIDSHLIMLCALGVMLGFYVLKKNQISKTTKNQATSKAR